MAFLEKIKGLSKKWRCIGIGLAILFIVLVIAGVATHREFGEKREGKNQVQSNQVYFDLLYLGNNDGLKFTQDQAKEILPIVEQMPGAKESAQYDLAKKVYGQLTTAQYQALLDRKDTSIGYGNEERRNGFKEHGEKGFHNKKDLQSPREDAAVNVVIKMLKDTITQKTIQP